MCPEKSDCTRMKEKSALIAEQEEGMVYYKERGKEKEKSKGMDTSRRGQARKSNHVFPSSASVPYLR